MLEQDCLYSGLPLAVEERSIQNWLRSSDVSQYCVLTLMSRTALSRSSLARSYILQDLLDRKPGTAPLTTLELTKSTEEFVEDLGCDRSTA